MFLLFNRKRWNKTKFLSTKTFERMSLHVFVVCVQFRISFLVLFIRTICDIIAQEWYNSFATTRSTHHCICVAISLFTYRMMLHTYHLYPQKLRTLQRYQHSNFKLEQWINVSIFVAHEIHFEMDTIASYFTYIWWVWRWKK